MRCPTCGRCPACGHYYPAWPHPWRPYQWRWDTYSTTITSTNIGEAIHKARAHAYG